MNVKTVGKFKVTVNIDGVNSKYTFFAWNAHIQNGKYWTYNDVTRKNKAGVLYPNVFLAISKEKTSFKVEDYLFDGGKYSGNLVGKYLTSYYDFNKKVSTKSDYEFSMEENFSTIISEATNLPTQNPTEKSDESTQNPTMGQDEPQLPQGEELNISNLTLKRDNVYIVKSRYPN